MELVIVMTLIALLASVAFPAYSGYIEEARVSSAIGDMGRISLAIDRFRMQNGDALPASLDDLDLPSKKDPWDRDYVYRDLTDPANAGLFRKKGTAKLNADYDLLSKGPDGVSARNITNSKAHDDIIRANGGAYMGIAEGY